MKLSKDELIYLLRGVGTEWGPSEDVSRAEHVIDALETNTLEIEGYERVQWTRLDPNDPTTYPKEGTPVLFASYNPIDKWGMLAGIASKDFIDDWKNISRFLAVVFWKEMMFQPPPVETEGSNETD